MTGLEVAEPGEDAVSGAEYVAMVLMCPLQQASRIELLEPPMGTAHEGWVVGGCGIEVTGWQNMVAVLYLGIMFVRKSGLSKL